MRLSSWNLDHLLYKAGLLVADGFKVVRPVYVDWWWRGYSINLEPLK